MAFCATYIRLSRQSSVLIHGIALPLLLLLSRLLQRRVEEAESLELYLAVGISSGSCCGGAGGNHSFALHLAYPLLVVEPGVTLDLLPQLALLVGCVRAAAVVHGLGIERHLSCGVADHADVNVASGAEIVENTSLDRAADEL